MLAAVLCVCADLLLAVLVSPLSHTLSTAISMLPLISIPLLTMGDVVFIIFFNGGVPARKTLDRAS